jgi:hypothetical protein
MKSIKKSERHIKSTAKSVNRDSTSQLRGEHLSKCAAWGCQCQNKREKSKIAKVLPTPKKPSTELKRLDRDYGNRKVIRNTLFNHPKMNKIKSNYPRLYKWNLI